MIESRVTDEMVLSAVLAMRVQQRLLVGVEHPNPEAPITDAEAQFARAVVSAALLAEVTAEPLLPRKSVQALEDRVLAAERELRSLRGALQAAAGCSCPVGFGSQRDPKCPKHGARAAA